MRKKGSNLIDSREAKKINIARFAHKIVNWDLSWFWSTDTQILELAHSRYKILQIIVVFDMRRIVFVTVYKCMYPEQNQGHTDDDKR